MAGHTIDAVEVARWAPHILVLDAVAPGAHIDAFRHRAPARFTAPAIRFSAPQPLYVTGDAFTIVAEQSGLVAESTYLAGEHAWPRLFDPPRAIIPTPDRPILVAGNSAARNYWHWMFQCLAPLLLALELGLDDCAALLPTLTPAMRDHLALAGVAADRLIMLPTDAAAAPRQGLYSNLTGGGFAFTPHPRLIAAYAEMGRRPPRSPFAGGRLFISRAGSANRIMQNEEALRSALEPLGFTTILPDRLAPAEQIALFRDAAVIVAQHGAALTNLLFARAGEDAPIVVELHQDNFLNQCFLKLCQAKRLRYTAVVGAMTDPGCDGRHDSRWAADIPLILRTVANL